MTLNIILLTPKRRFIANRFGLGYQIPLGLVFLGGPLADAGHRVRLIDNDLYGWSDARLVKELAAAPPDVLMLGHTASTAAHPAAMRTAAALKAAFPRMQLVYGGVFASYTAPDILKQNPAIDLILQGEGERAALELVAELENPVPSLITVRGLVWREGGHIHTNPAQPPITDLDAYRPGWELVDWPGYSLFGFGRAAGMQFSRGCTLHCTYCGQWAFWKRWRHRSPRNFVDELQMLRDRYGVRIVWLADEHFAAQPDAAQQALAELAGRNLGLTLNANLTAASVVQQADWLALYKQAGVDNIVMGIESLEDDTVEKVNKDNPYDISAEAVRLLRQHHILSLVNVIYGLEEDDWRSMWRTFRSLLALDPDVVNSEYLTPHHWTHDGHRVQPGQLIQTDQAKWTYRNQVLAAPRLQPWALFLGVKLTEFLFHIRPRALWRMLAAQDPRHRKLLRQYFYVGAKVFIAEVFEFLFATQFAAAGETTEHPALAPAKSGG